MRAKLPVVEQLMQMSQFGQAWRLPWKLRAGPSELLLPLEFVLRLVNL